MTQNANFWHPSKYKLASTLHINALKMSTSTHASFQENDIHLLQTGDFADGVVKCNGRTWNVHRMLLASRLRFFKAAFYGQFAVRTSIITIPEIIR